MIACHTCGLVHSIEGLERGQEARCVQCDALLRPDKPFSRSRTAALALAALFLYVPANLYPILRMSYMGRYSESTVWDGVVTLFRDGMWFVAAVVFIASILVPLLKLVALFGLVSVPKRPRWQRQWTRVYKLVCAIGPWAMLDVFLLAVLVALVKMGDFATIMPGPGIFAFTGVVVLTILASSSFDPRLIWEEKA